MPLVQDYELNMGSYGASGVSKEFWIYFETKKYKKFAVQPY
jgi:hypothetical protein